MNTDFDVAIAGAGPVGLLIANFLGQRGIRTVILEQLPELIDYPRGVGIDDETLRTIQAAGLIDSVMEHVTPNQIMHFTSSSGRIFASLQPTTDEFGFPRRNSFIQPLVDKVLADGLKRYPCVDLRFGQEVAAFEQDDDRVSIQFTGGQPPLTARYLVACDGGNSLIRRSLGIKFEGRTAANRWIVVDIANDPLGAPDSFLHGRPSRPYVSIALPHGLRRFEFMLFDGEAPDDVVSDEMLHSLLQPLIARPDDIDLIRARVYRHNGRLAERFRDGRIILAGDAAHIMPVWQGQGYNSGVRDAFNLAWKLALVVDNKANDSLLDTYGAERREHARAMISLSEAAGVIFSPTNRIVAKFRDALVRLIGIIPSIRSYFLEMRFKPMPRYKEGALFYQQGYADNSAVGRMFIQPLVDRGDGPAKLDEVLGNGFALLAWGVDPRRWLDDEALRIAEDLGIKIISAVPTTQAAFERKRADLEIVGDHQGRLKTWFGLQNRAVVLLRPDRFVAAISSPQDVSHAIKEFARIASIKP
jgi:3-(3-hydroxy-phenyl)propionate hydroxylase